MDVLFNGGAVAGYVTDRIGTLHNVLATNEAALEAEITPLEALIIAETPLDVAGLTTLVASLTTIKNNLSSAVV